MKDNYEGTIRINKGISANTVSADVIAVGDQASAKKTLYPGYDHAREIRVAIDSLRKTIAAQISDPNAHSQLDLDLRLLEGLMEKDKVNPGKVQKVLTGLAGKLNHLKGYFSDAASIGEHIKTIAGLLKIPLSLIGLSF